MTHYLFRSGDGNEGDFPYFIVALKDDESPYAALQALLANRYIAGTKARRHIIGNTMIDGDEEHGLYATVLEGPRGETAFGAAWLTAQLEPIKDENLDYQQDQWGRSVYCLREILDNAAWRLFKKENKK